MKKLLIVAIIAMVGGMLFISCDEDAGTKVLSSMNGAGPGTCLEITTSIPEIQEFYVTFGYTEDACPSANIVGTCTVDFSDSGLSWVLDYIYYSSDFTAGEAATECTGLSGTLN